MKFITFILSIYILALNLTPCEDEVVVDSKNNKEISEMNDVEHQHEKDADFCSPFCICQCCHINAMSFKLVNFKFSIADISTQDFFHLNGLEKDFTTSILQPPRA